MKLHIATSTSHVPNLPFEMSRFPGPNKLTQVSHRDPKTSPAASACRRVLDKNTSSPEVFHRKIIFQFPIFRFYVNFRCCNCFCWVTPLKSNKLIPKNRRLFFNELPFPTIFFGYPAVGFRGYILRRDVLRTPKGRKHMIETYNT